MHSTATGYTIDTSISRSSGTSKRDGLVFIQTFSASSSSSLDTPSSPGTSLSELSDVTYEPSVLIQSHRNSHSGSIPSTSSINARKLSRKLPPNLTESLECLASYHSTKPIIPIAHQKDIFSPTYTLAVSAPFGSQSETPFTPLPAPIRSARNPLRKMSSGGKLSISAPTAVVPPTPTSTAPSAASPSSASEPDTLTPLTPRTSLPSLRAGPRHSLFGSSSLLGKQALPSSSTSSLRSPRQSVDQSSRFAPSEGVPALSCSSTSAGESSSCGTWSSFDPEHQHQHGRSASARVRETRKERKARHAEEKARFDESTPPTTKELYEASLMDVIDENGQRVRFGDLVRGKKTIVVFIRHWFCPLCAQYIKSVIRDVSPDALEEAGVELIIIGNGSAKMINGYANKFFNSPFKTYTDPTLSLYRLLGLTRQTMDAGADSDRGDYLTETALETTVSTLKRATKMPLRNPGHFTQLGGEFVFDGTLNVTYTHRMINTRAHAPIRDVCREAGVRLEFIHYEPGPAPPVVHMRSTEMLGHYPTEEEGAGGEEAEIDDWYAQKEKTLERIRMMRAERRNGSVDMRTPSERGVRVVIPEEDEEIDEFGQLTRELYA